MRAEIGVDDPDTIVIGSVGRLVAEKGYPELFEACEQLPRRYRLVVVGGDDPDKPDALPRSVVDRAREQGVIFLGQRDDVDRLYTAMDLFVLASHREGFPRAAMEATAMGIPVVATDVRGCREIVDPEATGLLVPVRDARSLTAAIRRLGDDPDLRARMSQSGLARAHEHFDERRVVDRVLDTYRAVAARKHLVLPNL